MGGSGVSLTKAHRVLLRLSWGWEPVAYVAKMTGSMTMFLREGTGGPTRASGLITLGSVVEGGYAGNTDEGLREVFVSSLWALLEIVFLCWDFISPATCNFSPIFMLFCICNQSISMALYLLALCSLYSVCIGQARSILPYTIYIT